MSTKNFTVSVSWAEGTTYSTEEEYDAYAIVRTVIENYKTTHICKDSIVVKKGRMVLDPNPRKIGLSITDPDSILWMRHFLLCVGDHLLGEVNIIESWAQ